MFFADGSSFSMPDPHCRYPVGSLKHLAQLAWGQDAVIEPKTQSKPGARPALGGKLVLSERGLRVAKSHRKPAASPALINTIYAMKRSLYEQLGGWPKLPGIWGYSEQAFTLASWFRGVPIRVDGQFTCTHADYQPQRCFPFSVHRSDPARNAH